MRMDQFVGLPPSALMFLKENQRPPQHCPTCGHVTETYIKSEGTFTGMFGDLYPLRRYPLKNGEHADEFLQAAPWSSGPIHFLALRLKDGTKFTWTDEEIDGWI